jgi:hypothetical protein
MGEGNRPREKGRGNREQWTEECFRGIEREGEGMGEGNGIKFMWYLWSQGKEALKD